ncbi:PAS domain-containing sensor histidine kinase [Ancylobacter lacus]|uniref:PAS domain-containing sensor histidine kinase n=1 Tax=Ancylobacter lacus TaxID=2579970 RepID=UPI001BCC919F|nr:ATP-binding protein [Ancylobacter lacus]MBS7538121.1 PAS domain S-box protein [Ancylobacter lacus]
MRRQAAPPAGARAGRHAGAAALAAAIFAIDAFTTLGSAVAVLYVLVLLIVGDTTSERALQLWTAACVSLTLAGFLLVHGHDPRVEAVLRLLFSLAAIVATSFILLKRLGERETLAAQAELLDVTSDAMYLSDAQGCVIYWNRAAETLYGWSSAEAWGKDAHVLLSTRFPQPREAIATALAASGSWEGELTQRTRDGRLIHVSSRWRQKARIGRRSGTTLETNTDITERRAAVEALKKSEQRFRTIFETLAVAIWEHDLRPLKAALAKARANGVGDMAAHLQQNPAFVRALRRMVQVTDVNGTGLKLMGVASREEFFSHLDEFLADPSESFVDFLLALDAGAPSFEGEATIRTRRGEVLRVIVAFNFPPDGALERVQASVLNITERLKVQEALQNTRAQLDHALRAATIGEVSASIAHEINQPLAAIVTSAAAARRWMERDPPELGEVRAALEETSAAARRVSEVVRRVRSFMAKVEPERTALELDVLVDETLHLLRNDIGARGVTLTARLEAAGALVHGDRILLQQVIINLLTNAVQAMETVGPERRVLSVRTAPMDRGVLVEVADTGPGFSDEAAHKAFEPFFTTKRQGMGLGLAMCRTIISAHDGEIRIAAATPGAGGRVSLWLPRPEAA